MATKKAAGAEAIEIVVQNQPVFTKQQLMQSAKYANRQDILNALIQDGEEITLDEVESRVSDFMKGKVN